MKQQKSTLFVFLIQENPIVFSLVTNSLFIRQNTVIGYMFDTKSCFLIKSHFLNQKYTTLIDKSDIFKHQQNVMGGWENNR